MWKLTYDLTAAVANLAQAIFGEEVFFRGSLRELSTQLTSTNPDSQVAGFPLDGNRTTDFDEVDGSAISDARECFQPSDTNHIGFVWYLTVDHANEIQTDSVTFNFGFYTEQCRHNNGSGQAAETQTPERVGLLYGGPSGEAVGASRVIAAGRPAGIALAAPASFRGAWSAPHYLSAPPQ